MIAVVRLGHRLHRDYRVTTHVALVARAFGASAIYIDRKDTQLEKRIEAVCERFGGDFEIKTGVKWRKIIEEWKGVVVHLTMYGEPIGERIGEIRESEDILVVVGAEKVPYEVYKMVDYNIAIGNQPHSEVAALAIFLDRCTNGGWEVPKMFKRLPSPKRCIEILKEQGCSKEVIEHCIAVRDLAVKIGERAGADKRLVEVGALLHDIGRSKTHGIMHGVEGARIARELDLPDSIVNIIERHLGAGISKKEAEKLGLPPKDYIPETLEEKVIAHADNLIEGKKRGGIEYEIKRELGEGRFDYVKRLRKLHNELSEICGKNLDEI
jgi:tRNA (cytidine56-2'-O)-methyltransferase